MADEGELAFVATMRDEATAQARAARRQLDALGGDTKPITIPLNVDADTKKALAEVKRLQREVAKRKLDVDVSTTKAKAKLAELAGQIAHEKAALEVDANDAEARARLAALQAEVRKTKLQLDVDTAGPLTEIAALKAAIAATNAHIGVEVDGAKAVVEAAAVNAAIDGAIDDVKKVRVDLDTTTLTEASKGVPTLLAAILLLSPAILAIGAASIVAFGGLTAGLLAAGGAAGALGLAVAPVVKGMTDAQKEIAKLRDKLATQTKGTKEYRDTLKSLRKEQASFSKQYGPAAEGLDRLKKAWTGFKNETRSSSVGVIGAALKAAAQVLRLLAPLANAASIGVRTLIGEFRKWARGPEMRQLLYFFRTEGPGMIVSFGHIAGNVLGGILQLFMAFAPEMQSITGGLEGMTARFHAWAAGLDQNQGFQDFLAYAKANLPEVGKLIGNIVLVVIRLAQAFAPFSTTILGALNGILSAIHALPIPIIQGLGVAIGLVVIALKAWQAGVYAVVAAQRVGTVATLGYTAATRGFALATSTAFGKLGLAAVGIGGVAAAAKKGGGAMSVLGGAASGAMAGAALGSFFPGAGTAIGGIIGGLTGLTAGLLTAGHSAKQSGADAGSAIGSWQGYAQTLDQVTGATTRATRAEALHNLEQSKVLPKLSAYGITARQAVDAVVNGGHAQDVLNAKLNGAQGGYDKAAAGAQEYYRKLEAGDATRRKGDGDVTLAMLASAKKRADAARTAAAAHRAEGDAVRRQLGLASQGIQKGREELAVTRTFSKAIKTLPKGVQTKLEAKILRPHDIVELASRYKSLDRKKIATIITENGGTPTKKQIDNIIAKAKALTKQRAEARLTAKDNASSVIGHVRSNLDHLNGHTATTYIDTVHRTKTAKAMGGTIARAAGGTVPGNRRPYGDSVLTYLAPGEEVISNARGQADRYRPLLKAINADALAVGGTVAQALARGGSSRKHKGKKGPSPAATLAAQRRAVLAGMPGSFEKKSVEQVVAAQSTLNDRIDAYAKKRIKNAALAKRWAKESKKALADELAAVKANAAARDAVVAKINAAKEAGKAATEAALQSLDVTSIAAVNDAPMTGGFIVKGLQDRVAALKKFQADLAALRKAGVDKALVGDLAQKGVEAAGAYAGALAKATPEQLAAVNAAQKEIRAQATKIGTDTTNGLAAGLSADLKRIDAAGVRLANALLRAVRRRLGIHSPSRELRSDGRHSVAGMIDGIRREIPAAEAQATALAARVQAAAVPQLGHLTALANASYAVAAPVMRVEATYRIEHVITSPDGSVSKLTAEQVADLIARDPKAAAKIERILAPAARRRTGSKITASDA